MPIFPKSTGYKMKGFTYPGESPLKIASVSGAQLVQSVGKTYDKYVNYGKIVGKELKKGFDKVKNPMAGSEDNGDVDDALKKDDSTVIEHKKGKDDDTSLEELDKDKLDTDGI